MSGLDTGASTLSIFLKVYLQSWENTNITNTLLKTRPEKIHCGNKIYSRNMVLKRKNGIETEFHRNGLLATIGLNFQEGQN